MYHVILIFLLFKEICIKKEKMLTSNKNAGDKSGQLRVHRSNVHG